MTADELLRMWLKDHAENRFAQAIGCEQSYRSGKFASVANRLAAAHRAAGDVYAAALRALDSPAAQPSPRPEAQDGDDGACNAQGGNEHSDGNPDGLPSKPR